MINHRNRSIPATTRLSILFGGGLNQVGWFIFGFGMIFFWGFVMKVDLSFIHFSGEITTVEGVATDSFETGASVNERSVYENHYRFTDNEGLGFNEFSYATGRGIKVGKSVTVEYPVGEPQYSRIKGMRRKAFGPVLLIVAVVPLAGLIIIFFGIRKALRVLTLLRNGELALGTLVSKERTSTQINDAYVYKLTFSFQDSSGIDHEITEKTHQTHLLEDDNEEYLLYL